MRIPRPIYFYVPAFLAECALINLLLIEPIYALKHFAASPLALGILGTVNGGGYALLAVLAGWLSDKTGRKRWVVTGALAQVLIVPFLPFCNHLWLYILLAGAHTTLLGCFWAPFMGLFSEATLPSRLSKSLSRYNMSWCTGGIVGSFLGGMLYDRVAPWAPFIAGFAMNLGVLLIVALGRPERVQVAREHHALTHPRAHLFMKQAWLVLISNFFVVSLLMYIFPKLAQTPALAMSAENIAGLHSLRQAMMLCIFGLMGMTRHWHFREYPISICFILLLLMMLLTSWLKVPLLFAIPFALFGVTTGIAYGLSAYYSMLSPISKGSMIGVHESFLSLGSTIGPFFGGLVILWTGRPEYPFLLGTVPILLFLAGVLWFYRQILRSHARHAPDRPFAEASQAKRG